MKRFLFGLAALPFLAGVSLAAQPVPLNDKQMDVVTAGFDDHERIVQNLGVVEVWINNPAVPCAAGAYLCIAGTAFVGSPGPAVQSFQLQAQFGP